MTIFKFAVIRGLRNPATLICTCVLPIALVLIRPIWEREFFSGFSLIAFLIMLGSFMLARNMLADKTDGAIVRILAAPVTMLNYLMQNLLACMIPLTLQMILVCSLGAVLYDWEFSFVIALILCYIIFSFASVAMSFAWNCLFKDKENSYAGFSAVITFVALLSGLWLPLELLPQPLQYVGAVFPAYWVVRSMDALQEYGAASGYWVGLGAMLMFTAVYLLYGGKRRII